MKKHRSNALLFADARQALLGRMTFVSWSFVLYMIISIFVNQLGAAVDLSNWLLTLVFGLAAGFVTSTFASLFGIGLSSIFLNLQYGQPAAVRNLFIAFSGDIDRSVRVRLFVTLGEMVCLLPIQLLLYFSPWEQAPRFLPLVPVICVISSAAYLCWTMTYAMTNYLLLDFPDQDAARILQASRNLMRGNRFRLFLLYLRLMPMHLLGIFSLGIANVFASCCQFACSAAFYKDLMSPQA